MRFAAGLILVALLAACGPIPKPFKASEAEKLSNPLLDVRDGAGVTVVPVIGAPGAFSGPLTEELVAALISEGVPASSSGALTNGLIVEGTVFQSGRGIMLAWTLRDTSDAMIDHIMVPVAGGSSEALSAGDPALIQQSVAASAQALSTLLRPGSREREPPPPSTILVAGVMGAPGDGNRSLDRAMKGALREGGFPIVREIGEETLTLAATVQVDPISDTEEEIVILWTILDADGQEIGTLEQQNVIPRGMLSGRWGGTAFDIAQANLGAIQGILEQVDEARTADVFDQ